MTTPELLCVFTVGHRTCLNLRDKRKPGTSRCHLAAHQGPLPAATPTTSMGRPGFAAAPVTPPERAVFVPSRDWDCNGSTYQWELLRPTDKGVFRAHMEPQESPEEPEEGPWGDAAYQAQMEAWRDGDVFYVSIERATHFGVDNTPDEWEQGEDCSGFYGLDHAQQEAEGMLARAVEYYAPSVTLPPVDWSRENEVQAALVLAQRADASAYYAREAASAEFVRLARVSGGVDGPGYAAAVAAQGIESAAEQASRDASEALWSAQIAANAYKYATPPTA